MAEQNPVVPEKVEPRPEKEPETKKAEEIPPSKAYIYDESSGSDSSDLEEEVKNAKPRRKQLQVDLEALRKQVNELNLFKERELTKAEQKAKARKEKAEKLAAEKAEKERLEKEKEPKEQPKAAKTTPSYIRF